MSNNETSRTAVATRVAAGVPTQAVAISFDQLERMATSIAKSKMFAVQTPEAALTLLLIAQSEGCHPAQALMDYDLIHGKPALKSAAMLARFQKSGGRVKWIQATDACVEGTFTHPFSDGPVTVKWDEARVKTAQLNGSDMHKKFPLQMKRARCITEGIRSTAPQCIPAGIYTVEETTDMIDITPTHAETLAAAHAAAGIDTTPANSTSLTLDEIEAHVETMMGCTTTESLTAAFGGSWKHAGIAKDSAARARFKEVYELMKTSLNKPDEVAPT